MVELRLQPNARIVCEGRKEGNIQENGRASALGDGFYLRSLFRSMKFCMKKWPFLHEQLLRVEG